MFSFLVIICSVLAAYLLGSIPTGFLTAKLFKGVDIRKAGSSNVGATNVLRVVGKMPAFITLVIDILKGVIAVTVIPHYFYQFVGYLDYDFYRSSLGLVAICGHIWTVFLKFKGGKGVATCIGVLGVLAPAALILSLTLWLAVFVLTHYVSLASMVFGIAMPLFSVILNEPFYRIIAIIMMCSLMIYKHKDNIRRLGRREENKTFVFKK